MSGDTCYIDIRLLETHEKLVQLETLGVLENVILKIVILILG